MKLKLSEVEAALSVQAESRAGLVCEKMQGILQLRRRKRTQALGVRNTNTNKNSLDSSLLRLTPQLAIPTNRKTLHARRGALYHTRSHVYTHLS